MAITSNREPARCLVFKMNFVMAVMTDRHQVVEAQRDGWVLDVLPVKKDYVMHVRRRSVSSFAQAVFAEWMCVQVVCPAAFPFS